MSSRLKIYNGALLLCGQRRLDALTDEAESRHLLDEVWNDGGVNSCLSEGQWRFAMRASRLDFDPAVEPAWGIIAASAGG